MKIAVIGSMTHYTYFIEIKKLLEEKGFEVEIPFFDKKVNYEVWDKEEAIRVKLKHDILKLNFEFMQRNDFVLVFNKFEKNNIKNYIGGNTFLEWGLHMFYKKKFFY